MKQPLSVILLACCTLATSPAFAHKAGTTLKVKSTAYTLSSYETDSTPNIAAWGDRLSRYDRVIAVSADLLKQGLTRGRRVTIEGLSGVYVVKDKMHPRWRNKIDVLMPTKRQAINKWGRRTVVIKIVK